MGNLFKGFSIPQVSHEGGQAFFSQMWEESIQLTNKMYGLKLPFD